jgi:flagellin
MDVNLSKAVRSNLLSLQNTATMMAKTQERLATGLKVNSAMDNPTNFFTASSLKSRASDLGLLMDSVSNAVQTLAAADKGITAITKLVESAQATARQALQTGATVTAPGAAPTAATITGGTFSDIDFTNGGDDDGEISFDLTINGTTETITIDFAAADAGSADASEVTASEMAAILNSAINTAFGTTGTTYVTVGDDGNGGDALVFTSPTTGATSGLEIDNFTVANGATGSGIADATATGAAQGADTTAPNPKRAELVDQYNELLSQINDLAKDASFNGVNLLDGDELQVIFNEDGSSKLDITGVTFNAAGLGLTALDADAFDTNTDINGVLSTLKSSIETLRTQASKFGSNLSVVETRQNFTKDMINVLETGSANLTLADTNEEAANLLALQTRQQLSSTALSMASQADQAVLRLF